MLEEEAGTVAGADFATGAGVELAGEAVEAGFAVAGAALVAELDFAGAAAVEAPVEAASAFLLFDDFLLEPEAAAVELDPEAGAAASLFALFFFDDFEEVLEDASEEGLAVVAAPEEVELSPVFFDFLDFLFVVEAEAEL